MFEDRVDFGDATFRDDAGFVEANFESYTNFGRSSFCNAIFGLASIIGTTNGANFGSQVDFNCVNFEGTASFIGVTFEGDVYFVEPRFGGCTSFDRASFKGKCFFGSWEDSPLAYSRSGRYHSDIDKANFLNYTTFGRTKFAGDARFNAVFYGRTDFRDARFTGNADFRDTLFSGNATFASAEFDNVDFSNTQFKFVSLSDTDFNSMKVEWSSLEDALVFDGLAYIKLIKNLREREQFEDADAAYYQYRQLSQANKKWSESSKLMDVVAWLSCGYGVKPGRPLIWAFVLTVVFALVYWLGKGIKRLKENGEDNNRVSCWDAFYFSVVTFTTVGYGDWYPIDRYRIVVMIEGVLGWLLLALFIVTLANVMIRP